MNKDRNQKMLLAYRKFRNGSIPFHMLIILLTRKVTKRLMDEFRKKKDIKKDTYVDHHISSKINTYLNVKELDVSGISKEVCSYLSKMYLDHRFDILGSGWVPVGYNDISIGIEGNRYNMNVAMREFDVEGKWLNGIILASQLDASRKIWKRINNKDYKPIDWQKDFKSGFRYSQKRWYKDQQISPLPGVDIKVPWELARMQHLPRIALFSLVMPHKNEMLLLEFKNQILDFIAANPPRMGVNWTCTMDVAIRAINILIAYDIFLQLDNKDILDQSFRQILTNSLYEHGQHIINNLEWSNKATNNHYLSNIVGLIFISSYLEGNDTEYWLAFSIQELMSEFKKQFYNDGGNYESSTCYHYLSSELVILATALIRGLKEEKISKIKNLNCQNFKAIIRLKEFQNQEYTINNGIILPTWYIDRMFKMVEFLVNIMKPNGNLPQIGDNDSGRILKLTPNGEFLSTIEAKNKYLSLMGYSYEDDCFWDENMLNAKMLISASSGILNQDLCNVFSYEYPLEKSIIKSLSKNKLLQKLFSGTVDVSCANSGRTDIIEEFPFRKKLVIYPKVKDNSALNENLKMFIYPNSGFYLLKSERLYCLLCGTPNGLGGLGGHTHNDKLSFEVCLDGEDFYVDPGTYIYTALPERRSQFRSIRAHNTIITHIEEESKLEKISGMFEFPVNKDVKLQFMGLNSIILKAEYFGIIQMMEVEVEKDSIKIIYTSNMDFYINLNNDVYSNGYGKLLRIN